MYVGRSDSPLNPVGVGLEYMAARGSNPSSFFRFSNGDPLTISKFTQEVCKALQGLGLPYADFARHSFRTGTATAVARAGVEDSLIHTLSR